MNPMDHDPRLENILVSNFGFDWIHTKQIAYSCFFSPFNRNHTGNYATVEKKDRFHFSQKKQRKFQNRGKMAWRQTKEIKGVSNSTVREMCFRIQVFTTHPDCRFKRSRISCKTRNR